MKKYKYITGIILVSLFSSVSYLNAQTTDPDDPPGNPTTGGGGPIGGSAAVGSGLVTLIILGGAYATGRTYRLFKNTKKEDRV